MKTVANEPEEGPRDDGDEEVLAMQKNERLMANTAECGERARKGPTKWLAQVKAEMGIGHGP